jgi:hypothetical protein
MSGPPGDRVGGPVVFNDLEFVQSVKHVTAGTRPLPWGGWGASKATQPPTPQAVVDAITSGTLLGTNVPTVWEFILPGFTITLQLCNCMFMVNPSLFQANLLMFSGVGGSVVHLWKVGLNDVSSPAIGLPSVERNNLTRKVTGRACTLAACVSGVCFGVLSQAMAFIELVLISVVTW